MWRTHATNEIYRKGERMITDDGYVCDDCGCKEVKLNRRGIMVCFECGLACEPEDRLMGEY